MVNQRLEYAGFWLRSLATLVDTVVLLAIIVPILLILHGPEQILNNPHHTLLDAIIIYSLPIIGTLLFWIYRSATPGKILFHLTIIDAKTGAKPKTMQYLLRFLGYVFAMMPLAAGLLWIAFDPKKQGWHDKIAGTIVVMYGPKQHHATDTCCKQHHGQPK
jgi:uncharacterized RDD family membrane protein YckC